MVSKNKMTLKDCYRTSVNGTEQPFFDQCYLVGPSDPHYEQPTIQVDTTFEDHSFPDFKKYSIPYFNIGNRAIKGYGYNGTA